MKKLAVLMLMAISFFAGCKKDEATKNVVGFWKGKRGVGAAAPDAERAILFRSDGTCRRYSQWDTTGGVKLEDLYQLTGSTVKIGSLNNDTYYGTLNSDFTRIDGTYGLGTATSGMGTFYMDRQ